MSRVVQNKGPKGPQAIGNVLSELMARSGFARVRSADALETAWREAAGPLTAAHTRVGQLKGGTLEIIVTHSILVQELGFQMHHLLTTLAELLPDEKINNLRFRTGSIG